MISKNFKLKHAHHDTLNFVFYLNITLDRKFDLEHAAALGDCLFTVNLWVPFISPNENIDL